MGVCFSVAHGMEIFWAQKVRLEHHYDLRVDLLVS